jgi:hypothetical protein
MKVVMKNTKLSDASLNKFEGHMKADDWQPVTDLFKNLHTWKHNKTGKTVTHNEAVGYWWVSGKTPVPF